MKVSELQAKQGKVDIILDIVSMEEPREFNKFGKQGRVCNAVAKDDSGEIKLTLWNEQVDMVKPGMKVQIKNGYVNEWQGEKQLSTGRFGELEVVGGAATDEPAREEPAEEPLDVEEDIVE